MNRKKLIYSILKEIEKGNTPTKADYGLELEQWGEIVSFIKNEGFVNNVAVAYSDNKVVEVAISSATITIKGIEYLEENNGWAKAYKGIKEVRDWVKLF